MKDSVSISEETGCGDLYVHCASIDGKLRYVTMNLGKRGSCASATTATLQDALNEILRLGGNVNHLINACEGHSCFKGKCCSNAIADALKEWDKHYRVIPKD